MADTGPFCLNEKVLVPHTDKFYEAKVLKAQKRDDGLWYYLLHYTGWNKKWDEWVEETGLRRAPTTAANASAGGAGATAAAAPSSSAAPGLSAGSGGPGAAAAGGPGAAAAAAAAASKKQQKGSSAQGATQQKKKAAAGGAGDAGAAAAGAAAAAAEAAQKQLEVRLPPLLMQQLLQQYDAIHDDMKLVPLPRKPNVMQIFHMYVNYARDKQGSSQAEEDICMGLQVYFDKALYQCLLFKAERQQADQALAAGVAPSSIYGAEHLLRLFVKLPELVPCTGVPEEQSQLLVARLDDVMAFMQTRTNLFEPLTNYINAAAAPPGGAGGAGGVAAAAAGGGGAAAGGGTAAGSGATCMGAGPATAATAAAVPPPPAAGRR